jgi:hypothetical protein
VILPGASFFIPLPPLRLSPAREKLRNHSALRKFVFGLPGQFVRVGCSAEGWERFLAGLHIHARVWPSVCNI